MARRNLGRGSTRMEMKHCSLVRLPTPRNSRKGWIKERLRLLIRARHPFDVDRKRSRVQFCRKLVGELLSEVSGNLTRSGKASSLDDRSPDNLAVEFVGNQPPVVQRSEPSPGETRRFRITAATDASAAPGLSLPAERQRSASSAGGERLTARCPGRSKQYNGDEHDR